MSDRPDAPDRLHDDDHGRQDPENGRERLRRALRYSLGVFLGIRVGLSIVALLAVALLPGLDPVDVPGWPAPETILGWHNLVTAWERFDALWFLRIATAGYVDGDGSAAFFPFYPLAIRGLSALLGDRPLAAALLISNAALYGALALLYLLTAREWGEQVARRTVLYLAIFPTAFFLLAPYSESLFLLLVVASLFSARRGRWAVAGIAGALAAATRSVGVLLVLPLAIEAVLQKREGRGRLGPAIAWTGVVFLGLGGYLLFWHLLAGDAQAPRLQQGMWQRSGLFPLVTLVRGTREAFSYPGLYPGGYHLLDWLVVVPAFAAAGWVLLRTRLTYGAYALVSLVAPLSLVFEPRPFMSLPRFLLPVFPLFWAAAVWAGRRRGVHEIMIAVSAAGLGIMTALFATWYYVF